MKRCPVCGGLMDEDLVPVSPEHDGSMWVWSCEDCDYMEIEEEEEDEEVLSYSYLFAGPID